MKELLKQYGFTTDSQYYEMIFESVINGQRKQARMQFLLMPRSNRIYFIKSALSGEEFGQLSSSDIAIVCA